MKKIILLFACILSFEYSSACADYDPDYSYYNLFMQESIGDPQYYPFLYSSYPGYYEVKASNLKNENIEEWQTYLGSTYDNTYHLVFEASREDVLDLIKGKKVANPKLAFVTPAFATKYKQALLYLAYAKYLEPYMMISLGNDNSWSYYGNNQTAADQLEYNKVINVLEKSWKAETDKELKLRYGYQLVRFAHYNRNYQAAIEYFNTYVAPLNYKPAMYYHALNHKAGAQRGLGQLVEANYNFFQVFSHSKNLKENAFSSMRFTEDLDFNKFLKEAKTINEKNDAYLMLGYVEFNNPLSSLEKIIATSPDAIQAQVLMARAINSIERDYIVSDYYCYTDTCFNKAKDKRFPLKDNDNGKTFFKQALSISTKMANNTNVKDQKFWNLTTAYLYFISKEFALAKEYLAKVNSTDKLYALQKKNLEMYLYISEQPKITPEVEQTIYTKYKSIFESKDDEANYNTKNFVIDLLANRYYLQKDYAKSFLMSNDLTALENNPRLDMLDYIEAFYNKPNKNGFEVYIVQKMNVKPGLEYGTRVKFDVQDYIHNMRGTIYLAQNNLPKALESFKKATISPTVSGLIFGYNRIECFECEETFTMEEDYSSEFSFINPEMNKLEITKALMSLQKIAANTNNKDQSSKANYLLGNFFYNTSSTGYYRHILRFDETNGNGEKYRPNDEFDIYNLIYFKGYAWRTYFKNDVTIAENYFQKAYTLAQNDEVKARIVFALSKCEQEIYYDQKNYNSYYWINDDDILIKDRVYFKELEKYKHTAFYEEVRTNCGYFDYYVSNYN